jgi:hypothetical protein
VFSEHFLAKPPFPEIISGVDVAIFLPRRPGIVCNIIISVNSVALTIPIAKTSFLPLSAKSHPRFCFAYVPWYDSLTLIEITGAGND